ncbi:MAG: TonB-dependent receptor [Prevotellaceae bacterium]|nr:TonB-dependent receptor [Prevotellaceae bacterium]
MGIKRTILNKSRFMLFVAFTAFATAAYGQNQTVTVQKGRITVKALIAAIKKQTNLSVDYEGNTLNPNSYVNFSNTNQTVASVMDAMLKHNNSLSYSISGRHIVVAKKGAHKAQVGDNKVNGQVLDAKTGEPIVGASVMVKGTSKGGVTDIDGNFTFNAPAGSTIVVSYIGYQQTEVKAGSNMHINIAEDNKQLSEVVVVGYGTVKKVNLTGAISAVKNEEIVTTKNENVENMLTGKIAGVRVVQNTAEPGEFNNSFDIRGMGSPLVIVDGVPRDNMSRIDSQDIESISVLKDASAAIYGVRAANGVVLITTKRGKAGELDMEYNGNFGLQFPSGSPKSALAADAMTILNEKKMHNVNGGSLRFSDEEIEAYRNGTKQSTDWYNEIMKSGVPQTSHNLNLSGGTEKVHFYASLGYQYQQSFIRSGDVNYDKWNMRANVTAKPFKNLTVEANMSGIMETNNKSNYDTHWIIRCMQRSPSYFPIYANNNPEYLYDTRVDDNPYAQSHADYVGTRQYKTKWMQNSASATWDIPWLEGLSLKGMFSYDYKENNNKTYWNQFYTYTYDEASDTYNGTSHNGPNRIRRQAYFNEALLYQVSLEYKHLFNNAHNVGALFLIEGRDRKGDNFYAQRNLSMPIEYLFAGDSKDQQGSMNSGQNDVYHFTNLSYIGRVNYDYLSKYLFEFSFRYDGSSMFAADNRWGFFPAVSAGWRVSEEKFWKDSSLSFINNFKVRASYGKLGDDTAAAYQYISGYSYPAGGDRNRLPGGYVFDGAYVNASKNKGIANEQITWYTAKTLDIGVDLEFWNGMLGFTFDYFNRMRDGLLATRATSLPVIVGASLPQENINSDKTMGFEIELRHRNAIKDFKYQVGANLSFTRTKYRHQEHGAYGNSYDEWLNSKEDRYSDIWWGYGKGGRFNSYEAIANSPIYANRGTLPGDYIYEDWNGDGVKSDLDRHPIAYNGVPKMNFGITLAAQWRGFDFNALFQGALKKSISYVEILAEPCWGDDNSGTLDYFLDRWRPADSHANPYNTNTEWIKGEYAYSGTVADGSSLFRIFNTNYMRLKSIELGYTLPKSVMKFIGLQSVRFYVNGYNLLTFCNMKYIDPEHTSDNWGCSYPLNKSFNFGVNVKF